MDSEELKKVVRESKNAPRRGVALCSGGFVTSRNPFLVNHTVEISPSAVRSIRGGYLWVYASDVRREPENADPVFVRMLDRAGNSLGFALYSRQSQIRLRVFSREGDTPTPELLRSRVAASLARRGAFEENAARRLIFGEGDLLPGIVVDRYGDVLTLQTLSRGADAIKTQIVEILRELVKPAGILERNDVRARLFEGLDENRGVLWGKVPDEVEISENGVRFIVDPLNGQKTGFFLDQRENRVEAGKIAHGKTLDCFTNSGGFALHFARRATTVLAVDISADAVRQAERNRQLNGFSNINFHEANVFDFLRELERDNESFDTICLDPPAFAKNRKAAAGARNGYKEINLRALRLLRPEGILITSSCSYHMPEMEFISLICEAAGDCRRHIQILERRGQAADHPALAAMPETRYLKCFFIRTL
ncbi:MAG: class I SAM-dependent rRNA methyltransferase [Acidobacteria bacterium]|nr:class I SAM-dependent rRNA methyltransferase [Acidobacteriota bacterium]